MQTIMASEILPTATTLQERFRSRHGDDLSKFGWRVRMRNWFGYHDSDSVYEAAVDTLVTPETEWLDVGGGKHIFPYNRQLGAQLAKRCGYLAVVDPAEELDVNSLGDERAQCCIDDYQADRKFDLATLRMVAEHIDCPDHALCSLSQLVRPGGHAVVLTPWKWAPVALAAAALPYRWHLPITRFLWGTKDEDVFPTVYLLNTRRALRTFFERHGFREVGFLYLDNVTTFSRFRWSCFAELSLWRMLRAVGLPYPERNLLGVYENTD